MPVLLEQRPVHQDGALLVRVVDDDADDRHANDAVRRVDLEQIAEGQPLQLGQVVGQDDARAPRASHATS